MKRSIAATVATVVLALALSTAGCGGDGQASDDPATAVHALQSAFASRNLGAICRRMTPAAHKEVGSVAHGVPTTCRADLQRAFGVIERGGPWGRKPAIVRIDEDGDRATVVLTNRDGWRGEVPMVEQGGVWKLAAFFGAGQAAADAFYAAAADSPFPAASDGRPVEFVDGDGRPCGELSKARALRPLGSCALSVPEQTLPLRMLTPFGAFKFGDCSLEYRLHVDGQGRTWTNEWNIDGSSQTGCADVEECFDQEKLPWKGRLVDDGRGGFLHRVHACVRTCIGMFVGDIVTRLVRHGRGWRIEPSGRDATGLRFDDDLRVTEHGLDIRPS